MNIDSVAAGLGRKGFFCDARIVKRDRRWASSRDGDIEVQRSPDEGIAVRAFISGSWGFASGRPEEFEELLGRAEKLARVGEGSAKYSERKDEGKWKGEEAGGLGDVDLVELCKQCSKSMEGEGIKNRQISFTEIRHEREYANSAGGRFWDSGLLFYASMGCVGKKGEVTQEGRDRWGSLNKWDEGAVLERAEEAARKCAENLKAEPAPHGEFAAVFDNELAGVFVHEAVGHACEGDAIVDGTSILKGKMGEKIGSELVSIIDNPALEGGFGSYVRDSEGMEGEEVRLIENGVLKGYLHSGQSAAELGEKGNGHARAEDYASTPIVRMSNTYMERGESEVDEVLDVRKGLYLKGMSGGSVDTFTGQFMFRCEQAFEIENGSLGKALRDVSITGGVLDTMGKVELVGKDFELGPGFCGKGGQMANVSDGGPHIRVSSARVG